MIGLPAVRIAGKRPGFKFIGCFLYCGLFFLCLFPKYRIAVSSPCRMNIKAQNPKYKKPRPQRYAQRFGQANKTQMSQNSKAQVWIFSFGSCVLGFVFCLVRQLADLCLRALGFIIVVALGGNFFARTKLIVSLVPRKRVLSGISCRPP